MSDKLESLDLDNVRMLTMSEREVRALLLNNSEICFKFESRQQKESAFDALIARREEARRNQETGGEP